MASTVAPLSAGIPVGAIVAYAGELKPLPSEWRLCDGSELSVADFPDLYAAIGNASGGSGNSFRVPDLQGRFLRGNDPPQSRNPGMVLPWKTAAPQRGIYVTVDMMATDWHSTNKAGAAETRVIDWYDNRAQVTQISSDAETRPVNLALYWIIKVKPFVPTVKNKPKDDLPVGGIIPFAGSDSQTPANAYPSFIRCNGGPVNTSSKTSDIEDAVGNTFTIPTNETDAKWFPPDLRGKFIRGVDLSGANDPDFGSRNSAPNTNTTGLGTWQGTATALKGPNVTLAYWSKQWKSVYEYTATPNNRNISAESYVESQTWSGGDFESRPVNAAVHFYINSVDPRKDILPSIFPVGGIIALPGVPKTALSDSVWLKCDGGTRAKSAFPTLYEAIGTTWGGSSQGEGFNLPDIRGWFLRGADTNGSAKNGDPDWASRWALNSGGSTKGPGSYQGCSTARPSGTRINNFQYPNETVRNAKTTNMGSGTTNKSAAASGSQTFQLQAQWDDETIPNTVVVEHYIRAS